MEEDVKTLKELGLTSSQAKVYLVLCKMRKANARMLSKSSKVTRQDIYRILTELREIGLIEKVIGAPIAFKAIPIEDGVSILIERKTKKVFDLQKKANKLIQRFQENNVEITIDEEDHYVLVPKREPLTLRLKKTIEATQLGIDTISSHKAFANALFVFDEEFKRALRRGVKMRWITDEPEDADLYSDSSVFHVFLKNPNLELRTVLNPPQVRLGIYDKKEVFMATLPKSAGLESPALWSTNTSFASIVDNFFETMWSAAIEYKLKKY